MKAKFKIFRIISCLLTITILCQSCNIYRSSNLSLDEAINANKKVRVKTNLDQNYIFKRIGQDERGIYGMAPKNSKAARQLVNNIRQEDSSDNLVKIELQENMIDEINVQNKTLSILVPLVVLAAGVLTFALTYEVNASPFDDSGTY